MLKKAVAMDPKGMASPGTLNQISLAIAGADKLDAAIAWLEISTETYPNDANLFGTLGDLYEKAGQPERAVAMYKKALEIDPNFEKAKAALKRLSP